METLTLEQLNKILKLHKLWLEEDKAGVRANLRGANLDYSCWPLHCGNKNSPTVDLHQSILDSPTPK